MTPHQQKLKALVDSLTKATLEGRVAWEASATKAVKAEMKSGLVEVRSDKDNTGQDAVRISLYNNLGDLRLTFDDTVIEYTDPYGEQVFYFNEMNELLNSALRSARGEDEILNSILNELDDDDEVPF
jgi:hypothetical protein